MDRQHRWCQPVDTRFLEELNRRKPKSMEAVERIWYNGESRRDQHYDDSRYHCLNLHSVFQKGTVEFRLFNGTLHAGKIKAYIQFCLAIGAQALNQSCASRRKTQTSNEKYTFRTWAFTARIKWGRIRHSSSTSAGKSAGLYCLEGSGSGGSTKGKNATEAGEGIGRTDPETGNHSSN